jgi:hypothetical protein
MLADCCLDPAGLNRHQKGLESISGYSLLYSGETDSVQPAADKPLSASSPPLSLGSRPSARFPFCNLASLLHPLLLFEQELAPRENALFQVLNLLAFLVQQYKCLLAVLVPNFLAFLVQKYKY